MVRAKQTTKSFVLLAARLQCKLLTFAVYITYWMATLALGSETMHAHNTNDVSALSSYWTETLPFSYVLNVKLVIKITC